MRARRFAVTASDRYIGVVNAFLDCGWEPVKLFTAPITTYMASNTKVLELAQSRKIPIQLSRMQDSDLAQLRALDCELLVMASYEWRIGDWTPHIARAINFHPAPLPNYRGPYPLVQGLRDRQTEWAATCHKVAPELDCGDILAEHRFALESYERHESLDLKVQMASAQLAIQVAVNLDQLWDQASAQGIGNYVGRWTDADREIDFNSTVDEIALTLRAFGDFECLAVVNGLRYFVRHAHCWPMAHHTAPGTLLHSEGTRHVVACRDGCVALLDWNLLPPTVKTRSDLR